MKFHVISPNYIAVYQLPLLEIYNFKIFIILRMRMTSNKLSDINYLTSKVIK